MSKNQKVRENIMLEVMLLENYLLNRRWKQKDRKSGGLYGCTLRGLKMLYIHKDKFWGCLKMEAFFGRAVLALTLSVMNFFAVVIAYNIVVYLALYNVSPYMGFSDVLIVFINDFGASFNKGIHFENAFYADFIASLIFGIFFFFNMITNREIKALFRGNGFGNDLK